MSSKILKKAVFPEFLWIRIKIGFGSVTNFSLTMDPWRNFSDPGFGSVSKWYGSATMSLTKHFFWWHFIIRIIFFLCNFFNFLSLKIDDINLDPDPRFQNKLKFWIRIQINAFEFTTLLTWVVQPCQHCSSSKFSCNLGTSI